MARKQFAAWMFRDSGEYQGLVVSLLLFLLIGTVVSLYNSILFVLLIGLYLVYIQLQRRFFLSDTVAIPEYQYPELYKAFTTYAEMLGVKKGTIYLVQNPYLQMSVLGWRRCSIVLASALVEQCTEEELSFLVARALGDFLTGHTKIEAVLVPLGIGNVISTMLFGYWQQKASSTADRVGLALTRDIDVAVSTIMKCQLGAKVFHKLDIRGYLLEAKFTTKEPGALVHETAGLVAHLPTERRIKNLLTYWQQDFHLSEEDSGKRSRRATVQIILTPSRKRGMDWFVSVSLLLLLILGVYGGYRFGWPLLQVTANQQALGDSISCLELRSSNMTTSSTTDLLFRLTAQLHNACSKAASNVVVKVNFYPANSTSNQDTPLDTQYIHPVSRIGAGDTSSIDTIVRTNADVSSGFRWTAEISKADF